MENSTRHAVVVGAGPVGCLAALMLTKHGWNVSLYEARPDIRLPESMANTRLRSINLAISHRGIAAIQAVDPSAAEHFLDTVIPMRGRMIHTVDGRMDSQLYDRDGQCINSIDRSLLNGGLLDEVTASSRIRVFFGHKVQFIDFDKKSMTVRDVYSDNVIQTGFDLCIGSDGSYSVVRRQMMKAMRMDYQQEYLKDEYIELKMPAGQGPDGESVFQLDPNHLHIWPRHSFMLIALANKDKSFTCTLFSPSAILDTLDTPDKILSWFKEQFPDALPIFGEKNLLEDFLHNPRSALICTRSNPYHYKDRAILLGDAAHSMVPFYGQGLNCGLEDVRILDVLFGEYGVDPNILPSTSLSPDAVDDNMASALQRYSESRHDDLLAICDLAMNNYVEMRHLVTMPIYIFKKTLDNILYSLSSRKSTPLASLSPLLSRALYASKEPTAWLPLYTMVTFRPDISYSAVKRKAERQSNILTGLGYLGILGLGVAAIGVARNLLQRS